MIINAAHGRVSQQILYELLEIEERSLRDPKAPVALILTSANCAIEESECFFISAIAKTYRIVHRLIRNKEEISLAIHSEPRGCIKLLVFDAHGTGSFMCLGNQKIKKDEINLQDFNGLASDAEIFLCSCRTGMNGLAQKIADVTNRTVFAPTRNFSYQEACVSFCQKHHLWEMRAYSWRCGAQYVRRFQKGRRVSSFYDCKRNDTNYFVAEGEYMKNLVTKGFASGQFKCRLGAFYMQWGCIYEAKKWYWEAGILGSGVALYALGFIFERERKIGEAEKCYWEAAKKGNGKAFSRLECLLTNSK